MTSTGLRAAVAAVCLATLAVSASGQRSEDSAELWDPGHGEACAFDSNSYTREDVRAFRAAWDDLVARAERSSDEWAGVYSDGGDTSYLELVWAPGEGYAYVFVSTCRAGINDLDYGAVAESPSLVTFTTKRVGVTNHPRLLPWRMVPVRWGAWKCLIPETSFAEFCRYAVGRDLRESRHYLDSPSYYVKRERTRDATWPSGIPVVPSEYERFVLHPLHARVASVGTPFAREVTDDYAELVTRVAIDAGWTEGIEVGNVLRVAGSGEAVFVVEVRDDDSVGEIVCEPYEEAGPPIVRGAELATEGPFVDMPDE